MSATSEPTAPDILGEPWVARRIPVTESPTKASGADHAVLVFQREAAGRASRPRHSRAVLYLHGRSDYFFQTHLAQAYLDAGFEFYALDLRACGRAGTGHASPHDVRDLRVHDEEISEALRIIRSEHGHDVVVLNGHSTGGLQAVIWAADHPGTVDAVVLNSPWLDLRGSTLVRSYGSAFVDLLSRRDPERVIGEPGSGKEDNYVAACTGAGVGSGTGTWHSSRHRPSRCGPGSWRGSGVCSERSTTGWASGCRSSCAARRSAAA